MRTNPAVQGVLYTWITVQEAGARLGGVSDEHVLALGRLKEIKVSDFRLPGARRGVYRVDPESVAAFILKRELGGEEAA